MHGALTSLAHFTASRRARCLVDLLDGLEFHSASNGGIKTGQRDHVQTKRAVVGGLRKGRNEMSHRVTVTGMLRRPPTSDVVIWVIRVIHPTCQAVSPDAAAANMIAHALRNRVSPEHILLR